MKNNGTTHERIELRSEKIKRIVGSMPKGVTRYGAAVIVVLYLALAVALFLIPYPYGGGESLIEHIFR